MLPVIGVTCASNAGDLDPLLPGKVLHYANDDYVGAVVAVGALPLLLPVVADSAVSRDLIQRVDALLVTGGGRPLPDEILAHHPLPTLEQQNPVRYRSDAMYIQHALAADLPVLGICRGHQMINEVMGGTTYRQLAPDWPEAAEHNQGPRPGHEPAHAIQVNAGCTLHRIIGATRVDVNSFHVQAVGKTPPGVAVVARAPDGVAEALESQMHRFVLGVQYHPERMLEEAHCKALFVALRVAAEARTGPGAGVRPGRAAVRGGRGRAAGRFRTNLRP